jgi:hypothetical protein
VEGLLRGGSQDRDSEGEAPGAVLIPGDHGPVDCEPEDDLTPWITRRTAGGLSALGVCQLGDATVGLFRVRGGETPLPPVRQPPPGAATLGALVAVLAEPRGLAGESVPPSRGVFDEGVSRRHEGLAEPRGLERSTVEPFPPVRQLVTDELVAGGFEDPERETMGDASRLLEIVTARIASGP